MCLLLMIIGHRKFKRQTCTVNTFTNKHMQDSLTNTHTLTLFGLFSHPNPSSHIIINDPYKVIALSVMILDTHTLTHAYTLLLLPKE